MFGGILADRKGHITAMLSGLGMIAAGFLIVLFFTDRAPWLIASSVVMTFGGLSFVKTVISASVAKTLEGDEAGSGMGMLNFACFLAEGVGIASVGGLLTKPWLNSPLIITVTSQAASLYSNIMLIFIALATFGGLLFVLSFKRNRQ